MSLIVFCLDSLSCPCIVVSHSVYRENRWSLSIERAAALIRHSRVAFSAFDNMTVAAERAQLNLERSIPELQELARKKLFTKSEISAVAQKRSEFEHLLAGRGTSAPIDYARYVIYELNLDKLRKIRAKSRGVKVINHAGTRRIFGILDRGNNKFPADFALWMQHIAFARREKAYKRLETLVTSALRLHPTEVRLWIYAGSQAFDDEANMAKARAYMQRGLRFCKDRREIWLEFVRIEMGYLAKLEGRRRILGLADKAHQPEEGLQLTEGLAVTLRSPDIGAETSLQLESSQGSVRDRADGSGVVKVIIDAALRQFRSDDGELFLQDLYNCCASFLDLSHTKHILLHIRTMGETIFSNGYMSSVLACRFVFFAVDTQKLAIISAMQAFLDLFNNAVSTMPPDQLFLFAHKLLPHLEKLIQEKMDSDIQTVISRKILQLQRLIRPAVEAP